MRAFRPAKSGADLTVGSYADVKNAHSLNGFAERTASATAFHIGGNVVRAFRRARSGADLTVGSYADVNTL